MAGAGHASGTDKGEGGNIVHGRSGPVVAEEALTNGHGRFMRVV
jgi:hypothetical protein